MSDDDKHARLGVALEEVAAHCGFYALAYALLEDTLGDFCVKIGEAAVQPYDVKDAMVILRKPHVKARIDTVAPGLVDGMDAVLVGDMAPDRDLRDCIAHGVVVDITDGPDGGVIIFRKRALVHKGVRTWVHFQFHRRDLRTSSISLLNRVGEIWRVSDALSLTAEEARCQS